jgi:hypothetical protein
MGQHCQELAVYIDVTIKIEGSDQAVERSKFIITILTYF